MRLRSASHAERPKLVWTQSGQFRPKYKIHGIHTFDDVCLPFSFHFIFGIANADFDYGGVHGWPLHTLAASELMAILLSALATRRVLHIYVCRRLLITHVTFRCPVRHPLIVVACRCRCRPCASHTGMRTKWPYIIHTIICMYI